jgi:hypothetical protein
MSTHVGSLTSLIFQLWLLPAWRQTDVTHMVGVLHLLMQLASLVAGFCFFCWEARGLKIMAAPEEACIVRGRF